jgi:hypothetical protein
MSEEMEKIHAFIVDTIAQGGTILVYNRRLSGYKTKHVKTLDRVAFIEGLVYVDGVCVKGWTVCKKP